MATVKAVLSKERVKKSGGYALVIQIIHERKKRVMHLGYDLMESNFNHDKECVVFNKESPLSRNDVKIINKKIEEIKKDLRLKLEYLQASGVPFTAADVIAKYRGDKNDICLYVYMQKQINEKRRIGKIGIADAYQSTLRSLQRFLGGKTVTFDQIDIAFLRDYENFLASTRVVQNTINYYMRNLRTIYNRAFDDSLISNPHNAFRKYHLHNVKTVKRALKKDEIRRIANLDLSSKTQLEEARDFFMFSFYTRGMSPIDIIYLKHADVVNGVIYYKRHKTNQPLQITVTEPLQKLLDKYNKDPDFVLPLMRNYRNRTLRQQYKMAYTQINANLKKVAVLADIRTTLTAYVARHSWATIAKETGAPASVISEGLGHDSEKTTLIYLSNFDRTIIDSINQRVVML